MDCAEANFGSLARKSGVSAKTIRDCEQGGKNRARQAPRPNPLQFAYPMLLGLRYRDSRRAVRPG